jgi:hypothetical protein
MAIPEGAITETVREKYGEVARRVAAGATASCCGPTSDPSCGPSCCGSATPDPITSNLYSDAEISALPETVWLA